MKLWIVYTCRREYIRPHIQEYKALFGELIHKAGRPLGRGIARHNGMYYYIAMPTISLKVPEDLLVQLESEARARRVTKSQLVREGLQIVLREPAGAVSCYDLARDLAGSVKGLPKDLADNPKYMDGFGE